jgi:hypothetical protein
LRQKEKYLFPDDGSRSPVKRSKGKFPDIERALSVWAKNTRKQGITLTDVMIREKARFFASSLGISDSNFKVNSSTWLEKFKHKNNVHPNGRGRSESDVTGIMRRPSHTRTNSISSMGMGGGCDDGSGSPMMMKHSKSQDSTGASSPESLMPMDFASAVGGYNAFQHQHSGSLCSTPLSEAFTDAGILGPASPNSPYFSPDNRIDSAQPSPSFPSQQARIPPGIHQRPRSQTFHVLPMDGSYISPPPSSEPLTPKLLQSGAAPLASPIPEVQNPLASPHMTPSSSQTGGGSPQTPTGVPPSKDDAKKALEVVVSFLRQQPVGFVEQDEYVMVDKLLEKFGLSTVQEVEAAAAAAAAASSSSSGGDTSMAFSGNLS